jgi:hypothetical protein
MSTALVITGVVVAAAAVYLAVGLLLGRLFYRLGYDMNPDQPYRDVDADIMRWMTFWCWPIMTPIFGTIVAWKALRRRFRWKALRLHPVKWAGEWMARDVDRRTS